MSSSGCWSTNVQQPRLIYYLTNPTIQTHHTRNTRSLSLCRTCVHFRTNSTHIVSISVCIHLKMAFCSIQPSINLPTSHQDPDDIISIINPKVNSAKSQFYIHDELFTRRSSEYHVKLICVLIMKFSM